MRDVARSRNRLRLSEEPVRLVEPAVQSLDPRELGEHFGPPGVVRLLAQRGAQPPLCCVQIGEVPEPAQAIAALCALATAGQNLQGWRDRAREEVVGEAGSRPLPSRSAQMPPLSLPTTRFSRTVTRSAPPVRILVPAGISPTTSSLGRTGHFAKVHRLPQGWSCHESLADLVEPVPRGCQPGTNWTPPG